KDCITGITARGGRARLDASVSENPESSNSCRDLMLAETRSTQHPRQQSCRNQHEEARANSHRADWYPQIEKMATQIGRSGKRKAGEPQVGGKNAASKTIFCSELQQGSRENPHGRAARVRQHSARCGHPDAATHSNQPIAQGNGDVPEQDAESQPVIVLARPPC